MDFKTMLDKEGVITYTNKGVSMMPLIRQGKDIMIIKKAESFKRGDAVLFLREDGQYVLHRITKKKGEDFFIIGDNCIEGEYVKKENILGILVGVKRNGKKLIKNSDFSYKLYVFTMPLRRLKLKFFYFLFLVRKFLKKIFGKK